MIRMHAHLLDVRAAGDDISDHIADHFVVGIGRHPRTAFPRIVGELFAR